MPDTFSAHGSRPHTASGLPRPGKPEPARGCLTALAYEAFCVTHHAVYARYAAMRLGSARAGAETAAAALDELAPLWASALTCAAPAAISWRLFTELVNARARGHRPPRGESARRADAVILREHLGLSGQEAAETMGLPVREFDVLLRAARRTSGT
ncbi:hypothetical protein [Streptomyces sp. NPDC051577]|uniref:hypothetical protein n=1 Tax=Streptomyces sp. NPDC051577 TaxID=3155166 RepID=UPI0034473E5C